MRVKKRVLTDLTVSCLIWLRACIRQLEILYGTVPYCQYGKRPAVMAGCSLKARSSAQMLLSAFRSTSVPLKTQLQY